jgi:hypothetical protein
LRCGHRGFLRESDLPSFGAKPDAPIAALVKRLKCRLPFPVGALPLQVGALAGSSFADC